MGILLQSRTPADNSNGDEATIYRVGPFRATHDQLLVCSDDGTKTSLPLNEITQIDAEHHLSFRHPILGFLLGLLVIGMSSPFTYLVLASSEFRSRALGGDFFFATPLAILGALGPFVGAYVLFEVFSARKIVWMHVSIWKRKLNFPAPNIEIQQINEFINFVRPLLKQREE